MPKCIVLLSFIWLIKFLWPCNVFYYSFFWIIVSSGKVTSWWGMLYIRINSLKINLDTRNVKNSLVGQQDTQVEGEPSNSQTFGYYGNRILENLGHLVAVETQEEQSWNPIMTITFSPQLTVKPSSIFFYIWSCISESGAHLSLITLGNEKALRWII